jgi:ubiquinone/menaquinone biosynthesis C-methylase UbiE
MIAFIKRVKQNRRLSFNQVFFMAPETVLEHFRDPRAVKHYEQAAAHLGLWQSEEMIFVQVFRPEQSLLDLGCGAGRVALGLWEIGFQRVVGIDFSREMIERARHLARLLEYTIPFRVGDATRLDIDDATFDGVIFSFNGLMQIPSRERRRMAMAEVRRVTRPGGRFVFTTHDRANPRHRTFWQEETQRWERGEQDPRLIEYGDRYFEAPVGNTFMHVPSREEVLEDLRETGWMARQDFLRSEAAKESAAVREFSDECRFWIAERGD